VAWRLFETAFLPWMSSKIAAVRLAGLPHEVPRDTPVLVCANHVSWWDGFLVRRLQRAVRPDAPLFTVMLERELAPRPYLRRLGALGLEPGSLASLRGMLRFLKDQRSRTPELVLAFFPQGELWPSTRRPLGFRRGVSLFAKAIAPLRFLPVGIHMEPGTRSAPAAYLSAGPLLDPEEADVTEASLEDRVTTELDAILLFLGTHGERAAHAWPDDPRECLPRPVSGLRPPRAAEGALAR
jgi:hypothetical protein